MQQTYLHKKTDVLSGQSGKYKEDEYEKTCEGDPHKATAKKESRYIKSKELLKNNLYTFACLFAR